VAGNWWPADYSGPPLISLDAEAARAVGLTVGDSMTVSILGREIDATIASLRQINWDTMGFNFVIVFSPGVLESAPHSFMATLSLPEAQERPFARAVSRAFPTSRRARVYDSVILKLLGATRARILAAQALEFTGLALIVSAVAFALGALSGWYVVVKVLELEWAPDWGIVAATLAAGAVVTLLLGLAGSLPALAARPARALRTL
jgi:putative ABC transport system permease protein